MSGRRVVVKVGGDVLLDDKERAGLGANLKDLLDEGDNVVVLHGGGPQVTRLQERLGLVENKVGGRRITGPEDLIVVEQAICGEVNVQLCCALLAAGVPAFGCHGASGRLIEAVRRPPRVVSGAGDTPIDFGEVGDVASIHVELIEALWRAGQVPVIATLGVTAQGRPLNINADTTSVQLARALLADVLLMVTRVGGVRTDVDDPATRIASVRVDDARRLIADGVVQGGMIPKLEEAMTVLAQGVGRIVIVNADAAGVFARALSGDGSAGTQVLPGPAAVA